MVQTTQDPGIKCTFIGEDKLSGGPRQTATNEELKYTATHLGKCAID